MLRLVTVLLIVVGLLVEYENAGRTAELSSVVRQAGGDIVVTVVDEAGALVPGACVVFSALTDAPIGSIGVCDNDPAWDVETTGGIISFATANFDVSVTITTIPAGYELAPGTGVTYTLGSDRPTAVTFVLTLPQGEAPAAEVVTGEQSEGAQDAPAAEDPQEGEKWPAAVYEGSCDDLGGVTSE